MKFFNNNFKDNNIITLHDNDWLIKQRIAGAVAAKTLVLLEKLVKEKTTLSLLELNKIAENFIISNGCTPTFLNYKGFPASVCMSVDNNKIHMLVHGIPSDYKLQDGDIITFDLGATYEGAIADTALTCIYGEPKSEKHIKLIKATEESLIEGIKAIKIGKRLGCIGNAIFKYAKNCGFEVINNYGGHGLTWNTPHAPPFVANKSNENEGIRISSGLTIAIEPMLIIGLTNTRTLNDGWTVVTENGVGAHFEHSIYVHEDRVEILTDRNNL